MMRSLVALCVRHYGAITALTLMGLILGSWMAMQAPLDVFPEFVPSQVDVQTEAPGFAPQQVEELVTRQVENAVNGSAGIATMRSESIPGLSVVTITFADGVDVHVARQGISERLSELGSALPAGVGTPKLSPLVSSTMDLLKIGLVSDKVDAYTLRDTANWIIRPRLLAVPGVAHVIVFGGAVRQIQIFPDTRKLSSFNLTFSEIADAAKAALPLQGAGLVDTAAQRILLKSPTPEPDATAVGQAVIAVRNNTPILLRDVADIRIAPAVRFGDSLIMGRHGVLLSLASQYGANTLNTTLEVEKALAGLDPALKKQGIQMYTSLHRPATFIERALQNLKESLVIAAVLILAVLYVFLRNARAAFIAFTAIPLSLLAAVAVLRHMGLTLNTMTLGGFAVALGVLVDDAIIGIENIMRRLRENALLSAPRPRLEVITGPHRSEFHVELKPDATIDQSVAQEQLRAILQHYPGIQSEVVTFLGDRISESLSGETAQVAIKIFGDNLDTLDRTADKVTAALGKVQGIVDLQFKRQSGTPTIAIHLVPQALAATGLRVQDVLDTIEAAYAGATVGQTFSGTRTVDVAVLLNDETRHQPMQVQQLMVNSPMGPIPLSRVANVEVTTDRYSIQHDAGQRLVAVTFNVKGSLQDIVSQAQQTISRSVALPPGVFVEFTGAAEAERRTRNELMLYSGVALGLIFMILFISFHWRANSWMVLANLPFSLIGSVLAIWVTGLGISLGTVVGLVTVFGISARNAILQLAHYEHLVEVEGAEWSPELVMRGANERLVPILMTAAVTALGLAPLAAGLSRPGQEIEGPMAVTVLGGLLSSTLLNLLVLPALAQRYVQRPDPAGATAEIA
jgi:Cu/Ag efflux pump CusA